MVQKRSPNSGAFPIGRCVHGEAKTDVNQCSAEIFDAPHGRTAPPFKAGDLIRRLMYGQSNDSRLFRIVMVNERALNGGVFTAKSADGHYADWGGTFPAPHEFEIVKETK